MLAPAVWTSFAPYPANTLVAPCTKLVWSDLQDNQQLFQLYSLDKWNNCNFQGASAIVVEDGPGCEDPRGCDNDDNDDGGRDDVVEDVVQDGRRLQHSEATGFVYYIGDQEDGYSVYFADTQAHCQSGQKVRFTVSKTPPSDPFSR